jgi:hypothetical protein
MNRLLRLILPHESNNHRAKLLHNSSLVLIIALLFVAQFFVSWGNRRAPSVLGISANISSNDLLRVTNQDRYDNGLPPLRLDNELMQAAAGKAEDMFTNDYWAHISPSGVTPWDFIKNAGYSYLYAGENLARGYTSADSVVNAWMNSPEHRANMLSPHYADVGFAVQTGTLTGNDTVLVVEEFGKRYLGGEPTVASADQPTVIPTSVPTVAAEVTPAPAGTASAPIVAQAVPKISPVSQAQQAVKSSNTLIASFTNDPLINSKTFTKQLAVIVIGIFLLVLLLDLIVIERKKIIRVASHNIDHIIYFVIILMIVLIFGRGVIL